ncbi:MAG: hypothetical protein EOM91_22890 [Sphingobacteriia bacterium]|nr:hypothetical protein [Sphingobacteriia bacterium]
MIDMSKTYRTFDGRPVRILCTDRECEQPIVGLAKTPRGEILMTWWPEGKFLAGGTSAVDLVEVSPYEDWPIDAPVWVRDGDGTRWFPRHFAGIDEDGRGLTWKYGGTSFSCHDEPSIPWAQLRLASEFTP